MTTLKEKLELRKDLISFVGGLEASLKHLDIMRQHKICCGEHQWDMLEVFGKGRASKKVVGWRLEHLASYNSETSFTLEELERAVESELKRHLTTIDESYKVVYNEPTVFPRRLFGAGNSFWDSSPKLLIKYLHRGVIKYVTGEYHFKKYEGGVDEFRLDGHNGDWSQYVTGWAYV